MKASHRPAAEISASSMADIAFLLLTFFLVTTVIPNDKGIALLLPEPVDRAVPVHERNIFKIQINSYDKFLVNGEERTTLSGLRDEIKGFILNKGKNLSMPEEPAKAVVSLKTDRGTTYAAFIRTLDEIQAAYYEIYASRVDLSPEEFRKLDVNSPAQKKIYDRGRAGIPMNISIAESTSSSSL